MALDFPTSPTDGQTFDNYIYDGTKGVWRLQPNIPSVISQFYVSDTAPASPSNGEIWLNSSDGNTYIYYVDGDSEQWIEIGGNTGQPPTLDDLNDVSVPSPVDGQALVFDAATSEWIPGSAAPSGVNDLQSDSIQIDFSDNVPMEKRTVAGDVTFTGTSYTAGVNKKVYLAGDTVSRNLTFPAGWEFIENNKPNAIGANAKNVLELNAFGTTESSTVALWLGAPSFQPMVATGGSTIDVDIAGVTYRVHSFLGTGADTFTVALAGDDAFIEYLLVGGGGAGGTSGYGGGGGGGNGTGNSNTGQSGAANTGSGGGSGGYSVSNSTGGNGGSGGGGAMNYSTVVPAGGVATSGQGFNGAPGGNTGDNPRNTGGGGGASEAGTRGVGTTIRPDGGDGISSNITGTSVTYAGGGGGAYGGLDRSTAGAGTGGAGGGGNGANQSTAPTAGQNGLGGGGGGGGIIPYVSGASGGSGVVIIRYEI